MNPATLGLYIDFKAVKFYHGWLNLERTCKFFEEYEMDMQEVGVGTFRLQAVFIILLIIRICGIFIVIACPQRCSPMRAQEEWTRVCRQDCGLTAIRSST